MTMARYYIRLKEQGRVLGADADDLLAFQDLGAARQNAIHGAKHLLLECIRTGRDPANDAILIVDEQHRQVEAIRLLDALPEILRDRVKTAQFAGWAAGNAAGTKAKPSHEL
jgi:hypothetical protein